MLNCHFCSLVFKVKLKIYKVIAERFSLPGKIWKRIVINSLNKIIIIIILLIYYINNNNNNNK